MNDVFDKSAETYSDDIDQVLGQYGAKHDFFTAHKAWLIGELLAGRGLDPHAMDLLDVGCGVGKIHEHLRPAFKSISGADVSADSLAVARRTYPEIDYRHYDGSQLPFPDGSFDMAMAIAVFHHVPPVLWPVVAGEMVRVLRPGGLALIIEHNPYNPVTRRIVNTCPLDKDAVLLSPSRLRGLFNGAGATEVTTRTVLSVPPVRGWLKRLDTLCGRLPFGAQYYLVARRAAEAGDATRNVA